jgi:hypothetical protein
VVELPLQARQLLIAETEAGKVGDVLDLGAGEGGHRADDTRGPNGDPAWRDRAIPARPRAADHECVSRVPWVTARLDRARRRLGRAAPPAAEPAALSDLAVLLVRADLERLMSALAASLGPDRPRLDSPARLTAALSDAIARVQGAGEPEVTRSPAGLHSPECWQIRITGADDRTRDALARLAAGERLG